MDEINLGNQKSVGKLIKVDMSAIYASALLMYIFFKRLLTAVVQASICLNFVLLASQNVPGMWHSPFNPNSYVDYRNIIRFTVKIWRAVWTQAEISAKLGRMGCLSQLLTPWSKLLQQNESYFHTLHINWDWMGYVTSLEHFVRQEVLILDCVLGWILPINKNVKIVNKQLKKICFFQKVNKQHPHL